MNSRCKGGEWLKRASWSLPIAIYARFMRPCRGRELNCRCGASFPIRPSRGDDGDQFASPQQRKPMSEPALPRGWYEKKVEQLLSAPLNDPPCRRQPSELVPES